MRDTQPFADLPDALVRDLLAEADRLGVVVEGQVQSLTRSREDLRSQARAEGMVMARADLDVVREPTVCGIDGSYQIHRLTALDLCAAAAVAVEGTIREEHRHWQEPHHRLWIDAQAHSVEATNAVRGIMVGMELELAVSAPHDLVLLDGAFSPLVIYLNQSQSAAPRAPASLRQAVEDRWPATRDALFWAIRGDRLIAVPKYATRNELARKLNLDVQSIDGKTLATALLEPGEYTTPLPVYGEDGEDEEYHLRGLDSQETDRLNEALQAVQAVYFRPYRWLPAVRLEIPGGQVRNQHRFALVLEGIARQLLTPAVFEPYPLFLADRMVKSLGLGVQVVEQAVSQHVVSGAQDPEEALMYLRQHRTEGGRGS